MTSTGRISALTCVIYDGILTANSDAYLVYKVKVVKVLKILARYGLQHNLKSQRLTLKPNLQFAVSHFSLTLTSESLTMPDGMGSCLYPGL